MKRKIGEDIPKYPATIFSSTEIANRVEISESNDENFSPVILGEVLFLGKVGHPYHLRFFSFFLYDHL